MYTLKRELIKMQRTNWATKAAGVVYEEAPLLVCLDHYGDSEDEESR